MDLNSPSHKIREGHLSTDLLFPISILTYRATLNCMVDDFLGMYDPNCPNCLVATSFHLDYSVCGECGLILLSNYREIR